MTAMGMILMNEERLVKSVNYIKKSFVEDFEIYSNIELAVKKKIQVLTNRYSSNDATIRVSFAEKFSRIINNLMH